MHFPIYPFHEIDLFPPSPIWGFKGKTKSLVETWKDWQNLLLT